MDATSTGATCDKCGVAALETWMHSERGDDGHQPDGRILQFCHHHGRQHQLGLYLKGFRLVEVAPVPA